MGINIGTKISPTYSKEHSQNHVLVKLKKADLGFAYGAGIDFSLVPNGNFTLGLGFRGMHGIIDISDKSQSTTTDGYYLLDRSYVKTYSAYLGLSVSF